jgi:hypothetical protein
MSTIKDRVRVVLEGSPILSSIISRDIPLHGWTHEAGGIDEISVEGLDGLLDDFQKAGWINEYLIDLDGLETGDVLVFNGTEWVPGSGAGVSSINALQGDIILLEGDGISITDDSSTDITITNTGVLSISTDADEQLTGPLKLLGGSNIAVDPLLDGTGFVVSAVIAEVEYYPTSYTVVDGTYQSGTLSSLQAFDDDAWLHIQEDAGTPGYDIIFDFTEVEVGFDKVVLYHLYYGAGASHTVHVQIYNYSSASWTDLGSFGLSAAWTVKEYPIPDDTNYINGTNQARIRLYHDEAGLTSHYIYVNYLALVRSAPGGSTAGVLSFAEQGDTAQVGNITISEGANVTITRTGTNFEIAAQTSGGVTDHGLLTGLTDDDHAMYFRHDGTRLATGNFDMDDHGITNVTYVDFVPDGVTNAEGRMWWNDDEGTINLGLKGSTSIMQVGQELPFRCQNDYGAQIDNGEVVKVSGNTGDAQKITLATNAAHACVFGVATEDITDQQFGYCTTIGKVRGLDTSSFTATDVLFLGVDGAMTDTMPSYPAALYHIADVIYSHATEGSIFVNPHSLTFPAIVLTQTSDLSDQARIEHNESNLLARISTGSLVVWDEYIGSADDWTINGIPLATAASEYEDIATAFANIYGVAAGDHSIAWYLGHISLDTAYNVSSTIWADNGAVLIRGENASGQALTVANYTAAATGTYVLDVLNNDTTGNAPTILLEGDAGTDAPLGHEIKTYTGKITMYSEYDAAANSDKAYLTIASEYHPELSTSYSVSAKLGIISDDDIIGGLQLASYLQFDSYNTDSGYHEVILNAAGLLDINADNKITLDSPEIHIDGCRTYYTTTPTFASNVLTITLGAPYQTVTITDDINEIQIAMPSGVSITGKAAGPAVVKIVASGADRDIELDPTLSGTRNTNIDDFAGMAPEVTIPQDSYVILSVYNINGDITATLIPDESWA